MEPKGWERIYKEHGEVQSEILPIVQEAIKLFKKKKYKKILDLCCGTGRHTIPLAIKGFTVYATDISQTGLDIIKKKAEKLNLNNIIFRQHDMTDIPFEENFFDGIICVWSTGHGTLKDVKRNVDEIYRILKPKGTLITDFISTDDDTYGKGKKIEENTFLGSIQGEEDIIHHYSTKRELIELFSKFKDARITPIDYIIGNEKEEKHIIKAFKVRAIK